MTFDDEHLISVAQTHGEDSEPDHEVGDLQQFFRAAWALLTIEQKSTFFKSDVVQDTYEGATGSSLQEPFAVNPFGTPQERPAVRRPKPR